jgi:hypothetical protein
MSIGFSTAKENKIGPVAVYNSALINHYGSGKLNVIHV